MKNLIVTTYFTSKPHPLYGPVVSPDDPSYLAPWLDSMRERGLDGRVFHDGLSSAFVAEQASERIRFTAVDPSRLVYSLNDQRFLIYRELLHTHPEIERIFFTDGNDVRVTSDPFPTLAPDTVYVGSQPGRLHPPVPEDDSHDSMSYVYLREQVATMGARFDLFGHLGRDWCHDTYPVLNAGILGGHRAPMMTVLDAFCEVLETIAQPADDLNMGILNYVLYRDQRERFVTGEPVHSVFGQYQDERRDVWFVHK